MKKSHAPALASVAQLVGALSCGGKVVGSVPSQGTSLGCKFDSQSGRMQEATSRCFSLMSMFFLPSSLPLPLAQKAMKRKMSSSEDFLKKERKKNHMTPREAVFRQVVRGTWGEHRAQAGHCSERSGASLMQDRELALLYSAAAASAASKEGPVFKRGT